ncbi:hypothetical protein C0Q70_01600 [Pomacea canaliculata]|uniref:DNA primase large subunit C-terminal domain-containing protein n=1 Tax=Pomacea canaliculata TaxID=400727 RepID=A0A2T7PZX1_POMCA|nr:hypothetical protein C0Q70_01600 [Pomacea canaliculata]
MTLYVQPPRGFISWQKLENFALTRLEFLLKVDSTQGDIRRLHQLFCEASVVQNSDCLIPGSVNDKVSHFIVRLLVGGDPEMSSFFCRAETALFDYWFSSMSEEELNMFLNEACSIMRKDCKRILACPSDFQGDRSSILSVFSSIKHSAGSLKSVIKSYLVQSTEMSILLPFQSVTRLLKKRLVILEKGMAKVASCRLPDVMVEQFYALMKISTKQAKQAHISAIKDDRMRILWIKLKHIYRSKHPTSGKHFYTRHLSLSDIDAMSFTYPLCMKSLLTSLREKHRLQHSARIQLTLFLKEMGLPIHHALAMWQQEYSQDPGAGSKGGHAWQTNYKRYIYNIRHLYGLEGARRNYQAHCCAALQLIDKKEKAMTGDKETLLVANHAQSERTGVEHLESDHTLSKADVDDSGKNAEGEEQIKISNAASRLISNCKRKSGLNCEPACTGPKRAVSTIHCSRLPVENKNFGGTFMQILDQQSLPLKNSQACEPRFPHVCLNSCCVTTSNLDASKNNRLFPSDYCETQQKFYIKSCTDCDGNAAREHNIQGTQEAHTMESIFFPSISPTSCFEHQPSCPESRAPYEGTSSSPAIIRKPVDYFHICYSRLLHGVSS